MDKTDSVYHKIYPGSFIIKVIINVMWIIVFFEGPTTKIPFVFLNGSISCSKISKFLLDITYHKLY